MNENVISEIYVCFLVRYPVASQKNTLNFGTGKSALVLVDQRRVLLERGSLGMTGACWMKTTQYISNDTVEKIVPT